MRQVSRGFPLILLAAASCALVKPASPLFAVAIADYRFRDDADIGRFTDRLVSSGRFKVVEQRRLDDDVKGAEWSVYGYVPDATRPNVTLRFMSAADGAVIFSMSRETASETERDFDDFAEPAIGF